MIPPRPKYAIRSAGLSVGLAVAISCSSPLPCSAQPPSSGSAPGTGTGMMGGAPNTTGTGSESGAGNATGTGVESGGTLMLPGAGNYFGPSNRRGRLLSPNSMPRGGAIPTGPGVNSADFPGQQGVIPLDSLIGYGVQNNAAGYTSVTEVHLRYARSIASPADRSLTLSRVASAATFSNQLALADEALVDAARAAMQLQDGLVRDQRLISIIAAQMNLAETRLRDGRLDMSAPDLTDTPAAPLPKVDRNGLIRAALSDWRRAAELSQRITNPTYRSELMYRVADNMAFGSQSVVNEFPQPAAGPNRDSAGLDRSYEGLPDALLQDAANLSARIDRPVWHDRGLVAVASAAAESKQFERALRVARMIPQPEVRTDALLKIAEIQARRGDAPGATSTYKEAALAVASIPLDDPRAVLAGVLIDNLISVGRFDDARASIGLYPDDSRRMIALGAIAESQGRRGAAQAAVAWINRDVPPGYRSQLYRRVSNGVVSAIEQNRSRALSSQGESR
jgi:hypothetical protein